MKSGTHIRWLANSGKERYGRFIFRFARNETLAYVRAEHDKKYYTMPFAKLTELNPSERESND